MRYSPTLIEHFRNPRNAGMMRVEDLLELVDARVESAVGGLPADRAHAAHVVSAAVRAAARDAMARMREAGGWPAGEA